MRTRVVLALAAVAACGSPPSTASLEPDASVQGPGDLPPALQRAVETSLAHFERRAGVYGLRGRADLALVSAFADDRQHAHVRFQQRVGDVPVFGGEGIVHLDPGGKITAVTNTLVAFPDVDPVAAVPAERAERRAFTKLACRTCKTLAPNDLWVLRQPDGDHLVWRIQLAILDGSARTAMPVVFVDAHDGRVVWQYDNLQTGTGSSLYSGPVTIDTSQFGGSYHLEDLGRFTGVFDDRNGSTPFPFDDADDVWDDATQRAGVDAAYGIMKTLDYYRTVHGRDGIDGAGGPRTLTAADGTTPLIASKVHYGTSYNNAFWDGATMTYGDGDGVRFGPLVELDVCGHELTHGVTQYTAGLVYAGESGALNESMSDVFGSTVERYAIGETDSLWKIGSKIYTPGNGDDDALRYLDDPHLADSNGFTADDDPDHYSERYVGWSDNGGVHINSGIANKAFYLVAHGGTHHLGGSVAGLGADPAERIWYKALTQYMTSSTNFAQAAKATFDAATALYGAGSVETETVQTAWGLCGVVVDTEPPAIEIASPGDGATVIAPMTITVDATDNVGVTSVQFYIDGVLHGTDSASPFTYAWNTVGADGAHAIHAVAFDGAGFTAESATIHVTVANETVPPVVAITSPAEGATVSHPVVLAADASDNAAIGHVEFRVDGVFVGTDNAAPYTYAWSSTTLPNGAHTVSATAFDTVGNTATSASVAFTLANDKAPPAVAITSPAAGTTVVGTTTITATADDPNGVARVEFLIDGEVLGADTTPPYGFAWNTETTGNGPHTLAARAYDNLNNTATSAGVGVTVDLPAGATYSATLGAPACATVGKSCDTYGLIVGRADLGPELHAPNTLGGACADGTVGWFHTDESLDRLRVYTTDGSPFAGGKAVTIEATVWNFGSDELDLHVTTTPEAPSWTLIGTLSPTAYGANTLTTTFVLPADATQVAIRGTFRYSNSVSPCSTGVYDDHDDLVFAIDSVPDTTPPTVAITSPADGAQVSAGPTTVTATASDDFAVTEVALDVDGAQVALDASAPYAFAWVATPGAHTLTTRARDSAGHVTTSAPVEVTVVDTTAPTVAITAPAAGASVIGTVVVAASASDAGGVAEVAFLLDGTAIATDAAAPYFVAWDTVPVAAGPHVLTARATDSAGNATTSAPVAITVTKDTTPPAVAITSPADGATVAYGVAIQASASDDHELASVAFFVDGTAIGSDPVAPYAATWDTGTDANNGPHTLTARAVDRYGNATTSAPITVTVDNPDTTPPIVVVTAPSDGVTLSGEFTIEATASDNRGLSHVDFLIDDQLYANDFAAPYSFTWFTTGFASGPHTLTARAYDTSNNPTTSFPVTVTFDNPDTSAPHVTITAPTSPGTVGGLVEVTATATDDTYGTGVASVELVIDGVPVATDSVAPYRFTWDTTAGDNGYRGVEVRATDGAGNIGSDYATIYVDNGIATATYDATLRAPRCPHAWNGCDTAALVDGRGTRGPEPNASNTIHGSCADGNTGTYHADESIDRVRVTSTAGVPLKWGNTARIEVTIWNFSNLLSSDLVDLWYTTDAANPSWTYLTTLDPGRTKGPRVVSTTMTLGFGPVQAVRANLRRRSLLVPGDALPCSAGNYNDHDDLVFAVATY